jgi:DNA-binding IclR family transcriptional regulator
MITPSSLPSKPERPSAPGGAAAVDRALSLLSAFHGDDASLSLAQLAERTDLYKSTALRLLASLEHAGMVQKLEDGRYGLGAEIARLHSLYAASFSLERVVLPALKRLVQATGESAAYHVLQGQGDKVTRLCLFRVDSPHPVRDHIRAGDVLPADRGTGGRVLMAFDLARQQGLGVRERRLYAAIRAQGFHAAVGDRLAEVAGISAPVFHADGSIAAALTLTMPAHRYQQGLVKPLLEAARGLGGKV